MNRMLQMTLASLLFLAVFIAAPHLVRADSPAKSAIQQGACDAAQQQNCGAGASTNGLNNTIKTGINVLSVIVGVAAVVMLIIGGLRYVTSGGDSTRTAGAKNTILYAIIGLVVVALAQVIVRFLLKNLS